MASLIAKGAYKLTLRSIDHALFSSMTTHAAINLVS